MKERIFYFMIHAVPMDNNPEKEECIGAFINCWVKGATYLTALNKAKKHIHDNEKWTVLNVLESSIPGREWYIDVPESLECYDEACKYGASFIFYTYENDDEDYN